MSNIIKIEANKALASMTEQQVMDVLKSSLYPGAQDNSVRMVLAYCQASGLDPMQKPVHIVPIWDSKAKQMRDVVMPGIGLYRTQASRTGQFAGISEPEFGPDVVTNLGGQEITHPEWCRVTVKRTGFRIVAEFTAREYWIENYAVKGGQEKSIAPNSMWTKRPRGQLTKCTEAQALRKAFPELGAAPTADEKWKVRKSTCGQLSANQNNRNKTGIRSGKFDGTFPTWEKLVLDGKKTPDAIIATISSAFTLSDEQVGKLKNIGVNTVTGEVVDAEFVAAMGD